MFSAHMEIVSVEQDMEERGRVTEVVLGTFAVITVSHLFFGLLVYASFGEATGRRWQGDEWVEETILQNIGHSPISLAVKIAMSANLCFMMPMTLLPASKAIENSLGVSRLAWPRLASSVTRLSLVAVLAVGALALPSFEVTVALIGSATGLSTFTVPAICYLKLCGHHVSRLHQAWLVLVAAFGLVGMVFSLAQLLIQQLSH